MSLTCDSCNQESCAYCFVATPTGRRCPDCAALPLASLVARGVLAFTLGACLAVLVVLFMVLEPLATLWRALVFFAFTTALNLASVWVIERVAGRKRDPLMTACYLAGLGIPATIVILWYIAS